MLGRFRKFSGSIYAKILLGIVIIPFVFWGMGGSIIGGSKNVVVVIDKEKYSIQQFSNFIQNTATKKVEAKDIDELLFSFIGEKLMEKEIEHFGIKLSDNSLSKLIKHQKQFKKNNKFSRIEYEKFLIKNNITANTFETMLLKEEKKKQLLDFVSGGVSPSNFLVNINYDKINQERDIEIINLNDAYNKQLNFSENQIKSYFENNKDKFNVIYKTIKILELNPTKLIGNNEFNDLFFKKIDEIDDLIFGGKKIKFLVQEFNLDKPETFKIDGLGKNINSKLESKITKEILSKILKIEENEPTILIENKNKYFIAELVKIENIQRDLKSSHVKNEILFELAKKTKRKLIAEIIDKINKGNFSKTDFDKFSKEKNVGIKKIHLNSLSDDKLLKKEIVNQVYGYPQNRIIIINDIGLSENFLIYINKIKNVKIDKSSKEYEMYFNLSKNKIVNELYNSYDNFIKNKYEIDINYQALDKVKNYYN